MNRLILCGFAALCSAIPPEAGAEPLAIGSHRELFLDRLLIDRMQGTSLKQGVPFPREAALLNDRPWDGITLFHEGMFEAGGTFYLFYRGEADTVQEDQEITCLARSRDGLHWEKPDLGVVDWKGSKANNIVQGPDRGMIHYRTCFFYDPRPDVPSSERIKALVFLPPAERARVGRRTELWVSADGASFARSDLQSGLSSSLSGAFDGYFLFWSQAEHAFVGFFRCTEQLPITPSDISPQRIAGRPGFKLVRSVFRASSPDLVHWSTDHRMNFGTLPRDQIYESAMFPYYRAPELYIGLANRFFSGRVALSPPEMKALKVQPSIGAGGVRHLYDGDINDMVLLAARPGSDTLEQPFLEAFVRPGLDPGNWTSRDNYSTALVFETGPAEMSFLVTRKHRQAGNFIQRMSLRLDGFVSINAPYAGGEMVTVPLTFQGNRLELNYSTSAAGQIQVEIEDRAGRPLPGFSLSDSEVLIGDRIAGEARWRTGSNPGSLEGQAVRLRFVMRDADLYSLRFHSENGGPGRP